MVSILIPIDFRLVVLKLIQIPTWKLVTIFSVLHDILSSHHTKNKATLHTAIFLTPCTSIYPEIHLIKRYSSNRMRHQQGCRAITVTVFRTRIWWSTSIFASCSSIMRKFDSLWLDVICVKYLNVPARFPRPVICNNAVKHIWTHQ